MPKSPAWQRKEGKNPNGGLNAKGRASAKKEGHNLKPPQPEGGSRRPEGTERRSQSGAGRVAGSSQARNHDNPQHEGRPGHVEAGDRSAVGLVGGRDGG